MPTITVRLGSTQDVTTCEVSENELKVLNCIGDKELTPLQISRLISYKEIEKSKLYSILAKLLAKGLLQKKQKFVQEGTALKKAVCYKRAFTFVILMMETKV